MNIITPSAITTPASHTIFIICIGVSETDFSGDVTGSLGITGSGSFGIVGVTGVSVGIDGSALPSGIMGVIGIVGGGNSSKPSSMPPISDGGVCICSVC